jgi:hypothetical protein
MHDKIPQHICRPFLIHIIFTALEVQATGYRKIAKVRDMRVQSFEVFLPPYKVTR